MDYPGPDGGVVAFSQVIEYLLVQGGVPASRGRLDGPVSLAQDRDVVPGPVLHAAVAEFLDLPAAPYHVLFALLDACPAFTVVARSLCSRR